MILAVCHPREGGDPSKVRQRQYNICLANARRWIPAFAGMTAALFVMLCPVYAQAEKTYNFGTRAAAPEPIEITEPKEPESAAEEVKPEEKKIEAPKNDAAQKMVRFFTGTCLKFYKRTAALKKYMDGKFPALDTERVALFAPIIEGTIDTVYWDVTLENAYYILAKNPSSGKCDLIVKETPSADVHAEIKAVMDGFNATKLFQTNTEFEALPAQNKSVSIVNIKGHPAEKELGIVATTKIKDTGDNIAAILTLFTIPQETVEVKNK